VPIDTEAVEKHARSLLDRAVDSEDLRRQSAPVERILVRASQPGMSSTWRSAPT
jgi:hypothetical protein